MEEIDARPTPATIAALSVVLGLFVLLALLVGSGGVVVAATLAVIAGCLHYGLSARSEHPRPRQWSPPLRREDIATALAARSPLAGLLVILALALVVWAQLRMTQPSLSALTIGAMALGLTLFATLEAIPARMSETSGTTMSPRSARLVSPVRRWLLVGAGLCAWFIWTAMRRRQVDEGHADIVALWLLSLGLAIVAAWPAVAWNHQLRGVAALVRRRRADFVLGGAVTLAALLARTVALGDRPAIVDADEAAMAMLAVQILDGAPANPFGTGWLDHPRLFFVLQAGAMWLADDGVAGARLVSALFGTLAVVFTWLLCRRLFDRSTALVAASLLAVFHFHLHLSRVALNNVADSSFLMATLYFLDRGFAKRRRLDCLLAGFAVGLSQYFYFSARLIPFVAAVVMLYFGVVALIRREREAGLAMQVAIGWMSLVGWTVFGALLASLPLLAYFVEHPGSFSPRIQMVSIFASGWLEREQASIGQSAVVLVARNLWRAALTPFHLPPTGTYRGEAPFVGLPMAVPMALGLAMLTARWWQRRYIALAVAYWGAVVAVGLTIAPDTQRFTIVAPIFAVACALALTGVARICTDLLRLSRRLVHVGLVVAVALLLSWNVRFFLEDHPQFWLYSDPNTATADTLARYVVEREPNATVYFAGPPRMWYDGFPNIALIARDARGISVEQPWDPTASPPILDGPTLFVFLPHRLDELAQVRAWFPGGTTRESFFDDGTLMFAVYEVEP